MEKSEFVKPEMRGNAGLSDSEGGATQIGNRGLTPVCFRKSGNTVSVTMATQSVNLVSLCLRPLTAPET